MKTLDIVEYHCEFCEKIYKDKSECELCEKTCREKCECTHDWKLSINFIASHDLYIINRKCQVCGKVETKELQNLNSIFDDSSHKNKNSTCTTPICHPNLQ